MNNESVCLCDNNFETKEITFIPPQAACPRDLSHFYAHPIYVTKTCNIRSLIDYNYYDIVTVNNREEEVPEISFFRN